MTSTRFESSSITSYGATIPKRRRQKIPCVRCSHYHTMQRIDAWVEDADLHTPLIQGPVYRLLRRFGRPFVRRVNRTEWLANALLKPLVNAITRAMIR